MKRTTTLITIILSAVYSYAMPINDSIAQYDNQRHYELRELTVTGDRPAFRTLLACETIFSRKELRRPGYELTTNRSADNYFRCIKADCDPDLCNEIKTLIEQDSKLAFNTAEGYSDGQDHIILNITNNNQLINVGFWWTEDGAFRLFVQGTPEAFL